MGKRKIVKLFESRKSHIDYRINRDYIRNGIATIPCKISGYDDVINTYSVKDFETLNPDFIDYVESTAEVTPPECPLVLNIIGGVFYFMGDTVCDYLLLTGHDLRQDRRLAGRLASIKVVFSESFEDPDYTQSEVDKLYSEIEEDVNETIQEDEND